MPTRPVRNGHTDRTGSSSSVGIPDPTTTGGVVTGVVLSGACFATGFSPTSFAIGGVLWLLFLLLMWGWQHDV